jgi:hypothetical protein
MALTSGAREQVDEFERTRLEEFEDFPYVLPALPGDYCQAAWLDASCLEQGGVVIHSAKRSSPVGPYSIAIVYELGAVETDSYVNLVSSEHIRPFLIDQCAVGLEVVGDAVPFGDIGGSSLEQVAEETLACEKRLATVQCEGYVVGQR